MANPNKKRSTDPEIPQTESEDENSERETPPPLSNSRGPVPIALNNNFIAYKGPCFNKPTASTSNYKTDSKNGSSSRGHQAYQLPLQEDHGYVYGPYINPLARTSNRPRTNLEPHQIIVPIRNRAANHTITNPDQSPSVEYHRSLYGPHVNQYLNQNSTYQNNNVGPLNTVLQPQRTLQISLRDANHTITNPDQLSSISDQRRAQERAIPNYNGYHLPLDIEEYPVHLFGPHVNRNQNGSNNINGSNNDSQPQLTYPNQLSSSFGQSRGLGSNAAPNPNRLSFEEYHKNNFFFENLDQTSQTDDLNARDTDSQLQSRRIAGSHTVTRPNQAPLVSGYNRELASNTDQLTMEQFRRNQLYSQINQYFKQSERKRKSDNNTVSYPDKLSSENEQSREIIEALRKNRKQLYRPYIVKPYLNQNPNGQSSRGPHRSQESNTFTEHRNATLTLNPNQSTLKNPKRIINTVRPSYYRECLQTFFNRTSVTTNTGMVNENSLIETSQNTENPDGNVSSSSEISKSNAPVKNRIGISGLELQLEATPTTGNNPKTETNQVNNDIKPNEMEQKVQPKEELVNTVHESKLEVETVPKKKIEKLKCKSSPNREITSTEDVEVDVNLINNILSPELGRLSLDQSGIKNKKKKKASDNPAKKLKKSEDNSSVKVAKKQSDNSKNEKLMCKIALKDCPKIISLLQSKMGGNKKYAVNIDNYNVKPEPVSEVKETRKQEKARRKEKKEKCDVFKKEKTLGKSKVKKELREFNEDLAVVQNVISEEDVNDAVINEVRSIDPVTGKLQSCYFYIQKENSDVKEKKKVKDSTASTVECPITDPQHPYNGKGKKRSKKPVETDETLAMPGCSHIITETGEKKENNSVQEKSVTNKTEIKKVFVITQVSNFHPKTGELQSCYYYFKEGNNVQPVENNDITPIKEEKKEDEGNYIKKENENGSDTQEVGDINQVVRACYCEYPTEEAAQLPSKAKKKKKTTD